MIIFENKIKSMKKLKNISKIYTGLAFFVLVLSLSSCLKNGNYFADFAAAAGSVDLPLAASNNNGVEAFSFDVTVTSTVLPIYANVASPSLPTKATTVPRFAASARTTSEWLAAMICEPFSSARSLISW